MRTPAAAIAWEFRHRHRWGPVVLLAYLIVLAAIKLFFIGAGKRADFENEETFAFAVLVPLTTCFFYFLALFSFGLSGDLGARQSMYPSRMFTLPVTNDALAAWPMIYGGGAMVLLWLFTRSLSLWPADMEIPTLWPGLLAVSILAWTQALTWLSYPLRGMRVGVVIIVLTMIDAVMFTALELKAAESTMLMLLAPHVPLAYLTARVAVRRARHGEVPHWNGPLASSPAEQGASRSRHFASAERAQAWLEWRHYGKSLPILVGLLLPFELSLLFVFPDVPVIVFEVLTVVLLTPPFMAAFAAATLSKTNPASGEYGLTPFTATKPLSNASLIGAKLKVAFASTVVTWMLVAMAIPIGVRLSGTAPMVMDWIRGTHEFFGTPRAIVFALLVASALVLGTWKQLVQSLCIGMTGREWVIKGSAFLALVVISFFLPFAHWVISSRSAVAWLFWSLPVITGVLVLLKVGAASWVAIRLHRRGSLSERAMLTGAASWCAMAFALFGVLVWLLPTIIFRTSVLACVAILAIPLTRLSAAPLAVDLNRHR